MRSAAFSAVLAAPLAIVAGCGSGATSTTAGSQSSSGASGAPRVTTALHGSLTVLAAASLTGAFSATKARLEATHPGLSISNSFAGSEQLVAQLQAGAPADVVATADTAHMAELVRAGLVDAPRVFAHNRLEIAVAPGNPKHVHSLADLSRSGLAVVLADPSVPAGHFARESLALAHVTVNPVSAPLDVEAVLRSVELGNADAAIVYETDVLAAAGQVAGVSIPAQYNVTAAYPIARVKASGNPQAAAAYIDEILAGVGHKQLALAGFAGP